MNKKQVLCYGAAVLLAAFAALTYMGTRAGERVNALMPTFGGMQLWNDEILTGGWRLAGAAPYWHRALPVAGRR